MAYTPISGIVPQLSRTAGGAAASGYYLKGYVAGSTTPLSMGIDSTPTSTLAKCALNSLGYPISNDADESTVFIPHFNANYKLVLYTNATDADNNTTANAVWVVDNISISSDGGSGNTLTILSEDIPIVDGQLSYSLTVAGLSVVGASVQLAKNGSEVDGTLLIATNDYTINTSESFTLHRSYPDGILRVAQAISSSSTAGLFRYYSTKAEAEADSAPAGTQFSVGELAAAVFIVQSSGYVSLDGDITMGDGLIAELQDDDGYDVRWFGAKVDGVTDDSLAVQAAVDRKTSAKVRFPSSSDACIIGTKITASDKFIHISGAGVGASQITYTGTDGLFSFSRSGVENALYQLSDLKLVANQAAGGTALRIEQDQETGVVGGADLLYLNNLYFESNSGAYWTIAVHLFNASSVYADGITINNNRDATAQNDVNTKAFYLENSKVGIANIRALHLSNFYIQRVYKAFDISSVGSWESIYVNQGEVVGTFYGMYVAGNFVGAIALESVHMDFIKSAYYCEDGVTNEVVRFDNCDLRAGSNGAAAEPGTTLRFGNDSARIVVADSHIRTSNTGLPTEIVIDLTSANQYTIVGNILVAGDIGIQLGSNGFDGIGQNAFLGVDSRYNQETNFDAFYNESEVMVTLKDQYTADLDDLAASEQGSFLTELNTGATNVPGAESPVGVVVNTIVFDVNRAWQWWYGNDSSSLYFRVKDGGTFGAWVAK